MSNLDAYKRIVSVALSLSVAFGLTGCGAIKTEMVDGETEQNVIEDITKEDIAVEGTTIKEKNEEHIRAQDDFYGYVNKETILSYDLSFNEMAAGSAYDIQNIVNNEIIIMVEDISLSNIKYEEGSNEWAVKETYNQLISFLNQNTGSAKQDFISFVEKVNAISDINEAVETLGYLKDEFGICDLFSFDVATDYRSSDKNALYIWQSNQYFDTQIKDIYENNETRKNLSAFVVDMLVMSGKDADEASKLAKQYLYYLVDVSCETDFSLEETGDYFTTLTYYTNQEINSMLDGITMEEILKGLNIESYVEGWYIQDANQLGNILKIFDDDNLELIKTYLICAYVNQYKMFLLEDYDILYAYTTGYNKNDKRVLGECIMETLSPQISELYADYYFTEEMKQQLLKMQQDIVRGYEQLISDADWLSAEAKNGLLDKLHNMKFIYGCGKKWLTKENNISIVGNDFYDTYRKSKVFRIKNIESQIGQKPDLEITDMSSNTVNAQYSMSNVFTITVGIMHAPYFDVNASYEKNLGGLGMVIGHEMGHAFDSNCIKFDSDGNYNENWLPQEDSIVLTERLNKMQEYYSGYTVMDVYHVDGELTASENYADVGAMECLMTIVTDKEGRRKLFENYARIWCEYVEDASLIEAIAYDVHSPSMIRVNAVLATTPGFYDVYDVSPEDNMYVEPEKRVSRW